MRAVPVLLLLAIAACASHEPATEPASVREQLASDTHLYIAAGDSAGAVTAQMKTATGWNNGLVDLKLDSGQLVARAAPSGAILITTVELGFEDIAIPASLIGHEAVLRRPHLHLTAPAEATTTWAGNDAAEATATLALELSWSIAVDGVALPIAAPTLPPLPVKLQLTGAGARITAELRLHVAGELWSWADLMKLSDLDLVLGADTPASTVP
ncbi:MAG: hypothetical protein E6J90_46640 [Deltaproteobacteria bacterium]|nr:MAG: hypothetical protein E6J91_41485 [Deltaproteobacteria bacterium]TMQ06344.1 MAG: hypothetical protein E6J90_46640 [Deltaproteobacteria bacterium]